MGSFHTRKLSFFLQCVLLSFFSRLAIQNAFKQERSLPSSRQKGPAAALFIPNAPFPAAPGLQAGPVYTPKETREEAERKTQPAARLRKSAPPPVLGRGPVVLGGSAQGGRGGGWMDREGWRTGADPAGRGGGDRLLPGPAASF